MFRYICFSSYTLFVVGEKGLGFNEEYFVLGRKLCFIVIVVSACCYSKHMNSWGKENQFCFPYYTNKWCVGCGEKKTQQSWWKSFQRLVDLSVSSFLVFSFCSVKKKMFLRMTIIITDANKRQLILHKQKLKPFTPFKYITSNLTLHLAYFRKLEEIIYLVE